MSAGEVDQLIGAEELRRLVAGCFEEAGLGSADATAVADVLVHANLRGIDSHGVMRVPVYLSRVAAGLAGGSERLSAVSEHGAVCRFDAGGALGPAAAVRATDHAIELAREHGVAVVAVGSSTHFGVAGYYAQRAVEAGQIAIVLTNAPNTMAPFGGSEAFFGTNPVAVAAPLAGHDDFVLDMSTSIVARGKIIRAAAAGERIEERLALDAEGRPTTDAAAALEGCVLPLGGSKGSGLAMAIDILLVALAGADFGAEMASMYEDHDRPQNVGHLFVMIDPGRFRDQKAVAVTLDRMVTRLREVRLAEGFDHIHFAGELEAERARRRAAEGIPVPRAELEELRSLLGELKLNRSEATVAELLARGAGEEVAAA